MDMGTTRVAPGQPPDRGQPPRLSTRPSTLSPTPEVATACVRSVTGEAVHLSTPVHTHAPCLTRCAAHSPAVWATRVESGEWTGLTRGPSGASDRVSTHAPGRGPVVHTVLHAVDGHFLHATRPRGWQSIRSKSTIQHWTRHAPGLPRSENIFFLYVSTPGWSNGSTPRSVPDTATACS